MTSLDVSNAVNAVINAYPNGSRIGFSGVEVGQCPAPVCEYMVRLGAPIPPMANDRADGWGTNFPGELVPFFTHEVFQPGKQYQEGTIYMWNSPHIAFSVAPSDGSNTVKVFEQNADPDGHGCQVFNRTINTSSHTCTYVLIPITAAPEPPPPNPNTYEDTTPRDLIVTKDPTNWVNLNEQGDDTLVVTTLPINSRFPVGGIAHHNSGRDYYMEASDYARAKAGDYTYNNGISEDDLMEVPVAPYVPPAAPVAVKLATQIPLVVSVPVYANAHDADVRNVEFSTGEFPAGMYYQFGTENGMVNIGITNQDTATVWMNPLDNILAPQPTVVEAPAIGQQVDTVIAELDPAPAPLSNDAWKASYIPFHPGTNKPPSTITEPDEYIVNLDGWVEDLAGLASSNGQPLEVPITHGSHVNVYGRFQFTDGQWYYRMHVKRDTEFKWFMAVPVSYQGRAVLILAPQPWYNRLFHRTARIESIFTSDVPKFIDSIVNPYRKGKK